MWVGGVPEWFTTGQYGVALLHRSLPRVPRIPGVVGGAGIWSCQRRTSVLSGQMPKDAKLGDQRPRATPMQTVLTLTAKSGQNKHRLCQISPG